MARSKKAKDARAPGATPKSDAVPGPDDEEVDAPEQRPSQLDQIRAAIAHEPMQDEPPELPEPPPEPELPAHVDEPTHAGAAEPQAAAEPPEAVEAPEAAEPPEAAEQTVPAAEAPPSVAEIEPTPPMLVEAVAVAPAVYQPPAPAPAALPSGRRSPTSLALGIVLVVVGAFFLLVRLFNVDLSTYGWPLFVIIPGLTLLVVGFVSLGTGALVPGGILTFAGLVLAYQNATGDWASWAYAWILLAPGGVGLGVFLQGLRTRDPGQLRMGRNLMFWAALIFIIGFIFFESILNISGIDYGLPGRAALPVLLILIGVTLLVRNLQRGRNA